MGRKARISQWGGLLTLLALVTSTAHGDISLDVNWREVEINSSQHPASVGIGSNPPRFGDLIYRGGLALSSPDRDFGGLSALEVSADARTFLAISDRGQWLEAELVYDEAGALVGVRNARMAPFVDRDGVVLAGPIADAESLALKDDLIFVGFEREHRIDVYRRDPDGLIVFQRSLTSFGAEDGLDLNRGVEALAFSKSGALIALAESGDRDGAFGWTVDDDGIRKPFRWRRPTGFSPTGATMAGDDLLVVERAYSPLLGVRARIVRADAATPAPGMVIEGALLAQFNAMQDIDNFEGLSAREYSAGRTHLYVLSDDNFSSTQKTLLTMFELADGEDTGK